MIGKLGDPECERPISNGRKVANYNLDTKSFREVESRSSFVQGVVLVFGENNKLVYMEFSRGSLSP